MTNGSSPPVIWLWVFEMVEGEEMMYAWVKMPPMVIITAKTTAIRVIFRPLIDIIQIPAGLEG